MAPIFCGAPSHRCDGGNRDSRKVDREHASLSSEVARIDFSVVLFDAPAAKGETQTEPRSIHSSLLERTEQLVEIATCEAAAFVPDFDEHTLDAGVGSEHDRRSRSGELEGSAAS